MKQGYIYVPYTIISNPKGMTKYSFTSNKNIKSRYFGLSYKYIKIMDRRKKIKKLNNIIKNNNLYG